MARHEDEYNYITDYGGRRPAGDPTGLVIFGVIYGIFQLICWLCGQFWFWTVLLPIAVATPVITWHKTHDKQKTAIYGFAAILICAMLAMVFIVYFS